MCNCRFDAALANENQYHAAAAAISTRHENPVHVRNTKDRNLTGLQNARSALHLQPTSPVDSHPPRHRQHFPEASSRVDDVVL